MADSRPPSDERDDDASEGDRRRRFERAVPDVLRKIVERAVETGVETLTEGPEHLKKHLGDMKLPKEAASYVYEQMDDTKKGLYRVVAKEIRDVLEHMSLADELASVLTKLSFEINTQVRFVPNQAAKESDETRRTRETGAPPAGASSGAGSESGTGSVAATEGESEPRRKSHFPRPQVVSKVVMKAVDIVTGGKGDTGGGRNGADDEED